MDICYIKKVVREWSDTEPFIRETYLFGSRVFGGSTQSSDLDIAVKVFMKQGDIDDVALLSGNIDRIYTSIEKSEERTYTDVKNELQQSIERFFVEHSIPFKPHLTALYAEYVIQAVNETGLILVYKKDSHSG